MSSEVATPTPISQALSNKLANMAFVCACLVVFIHTWIVPTNTFAWWFQQMTVQGVCRIAVPFFFIAAGFFLAGHTNEEKWYQKACHKRLHTLLIPFILWEIIYWGFEWSYPILANLLTGASITRNLPLDGFSLLTMMGLNPTTSPALAPLWFVRALLLFILLSPLLLRFITKGKQIALCFLVTLFLIYALVPTGLSSACFANFWRKWISLEGLFYFSLGLYLRLWAPNLQFKWQHIALALIIGGVGAYCDRIWKTHTWRHMVGALSALVRVTISPFSYLAFHTHNALAQIFNLCRLSNLPHSLVYYRYSRHSTGTMSLFALADTNLGLSVQGDYNPSTLPSNHMDFAQNPPQILNHSLWRTINVYQYG